MKGSGDKPAGRSFRPLRTAGIAVGLVVFLLVFRPFGLALDSTPEVLVVLGLAPFNYLVMMILHRLPLPDESWRGVIRLAALAIANAAYLAFWSGALPAAETVVAVALVVGLVAASVQLWNRGRIPEQELRGSAERSAGPAAIKLAGESDHEILQLTPEELLYMSASGNYVDVYYRIGNTVSKSMLRCSLTGLAKQVPGDLLTRCHRSHLANLSAARRIIRARGRTFIEFDEGRRVPVSRGYRHHVLEALSN